MHITAGLVCLVLAALLVHVHNQQYWNSEPYPGGRTARELLQERPWLEPGIACLVKVYSLPLGLIVFTSLYGAFASLFEITDDIKFVIALACLWALPGFVLAWFFLPLFVGMIAAIVALVVAVARKRRKTAWFSLGALAYNVFFFVVTYTYLDSWFAVFGD